MAGSGCKNFKLSFDDIIPVDQLPIRPKSPPTVKQPLLPQLQQQKVEDGGVGVSEMYRRVMNVVSDEVEARRELVVYLTDRIQELWMEVRAKPDLPLVAVHDKPFCKVPHIPDVWFHPSLIHFQAQTVPKPPLLDYFMNIVQYCEISGEALIRAMFLLAYFRYCYRNIFPITNFTIHRLLATVLLCAAKFGEDYPWSNGHFARYALITPKELNQLESEFLSLVQFQLFVPNQMLQDFLHQLFLTKPTIKLFHMPFDIAIQIVTVKSFQDICSQHWPSLQKSLLKKSLLHKHSKSTLQQQQRQQSQQSQQSHQSHQSQHSYSPEKGLKTPLEPTNNELQESKDATANQHKHRATTLDDVLDFLN